MTDKKLSSQVKKSVRRRGNGTKSKKPAYAGNTETVVSTGSTLLDLVISGTRVRGGGLPGGIFVEIFGPSGSGKTVLLSEIAGAVQRAGGEAMFHDPEARLNKVFASIFDLDTEKLAYMTPDTIPEVFTGLRDWNPESQKINGIFTDSLAALSTNMEMESEDGDKMGMRRAREFSEHLRRTARILTAKNYLMVASNQVRENVGAMGGQPKYKSPGGEGIGFYSSLRLKTTFGNPKRIKEKATIKGKEVERSVGINIEVEVFKSSVDKPYRKAPVSIIFDYGIDDIRQNLQYVKRYSGESVYTVNGQKLYNSLNKSIDYVENNNLEDDLRGEVIDLWEKIEKRFESNRKKKKR
jgi:recombination protein RecA